MDSRLILVMVLTGFIHMADTLFYGTRAAAVRVKKVGIAISLWGIVALGTRLANTIQAPITGSLVDQALLGRTHSVPVAALVALAWKFRYIIFSATLGSLIGVLFVPTFVEIFTRVLKVFEKEGSLIRVFLKAARLRSLASLFESLRPPSLARPSSLKKSGLPKGFLIANVVIVGVYTTGVLSTIYSGALIPAYRLTADNLSGIVNAIATLLFVIILDPTIALITDQAVHGERNPEDVKVMVWYLVAGKVAGTLLAQLIFLPAAGVVASTALLIAKPAQVLTNPGAVVQFFSRLI